MSNEIESVIATQYGSERLCIVTKHAELLSGKSFDQTADQHQASYVRMRLLGKKDSHGRQRITLDELEAISTLWKKWQKRTNRPCKHCATEIEISLMKTGYQAHREYCSDKCRQARYRGRVRAAKKLFTAGKPIVHIAAVTETPTKTVEKWMEKWSVV